MPPRAPDSPPLTGKAATQDRILEAATQLFLDQGFDKTPVAQIAEVAGVSRATVFWHFSDKKSLFREAFNRLVDPFRDSLDRDMPDIPPVKRLHEQIGIYEDFVQLQSRAMNAFVHWAVQESDFRETVITTLLDLHQRWTGTLTVTISEIVPNSVDPRPIATALMTLLDGKTLISYFDPSERRAQERDEAIEAFAAMIPRRDGIED